MVLGWRRAFCTSIPKDDDAAASKTFSCKLSRVNNGGSTGNSPRISSRFGFFSNPSTPRSQSQPQPAPSPSLRCRTAATTPDSSVPSSPRLQCKTAPKRSGGGEHESNSATLFNLSNRSSPRSPSGFSLLKASRPPPQESLGIITDLAWAAKSHAARTGQQRLRSRLRPQAWPTPPKSSAERSSLQIWVSPWEGKAGTV